MSNISKIDSNLASDTGHFLDAVSPIIYPAIRFEFVIKFVLDRGDL